jgi:hypothetical protein
MLPILPTTIYNDYMKLCKDCQISITTDNAWIDKGDKIRARCKECDRKHRAKLHGINQYAYIDRLYSRLRYEVVSGTRRSSRAKLTWNISQAHLYNCYHKQDGKCALSQQKMTWLTGQGKVDSNISVDRINPNKGYEPDNIQLITYRCNIMKHDMPENKFLNLAQMITNVRQSKKLGKRR